jgi:hypothetical protein
MRIAKVIPGELVVVERAMPVPGEAEAMNQDAYKERDLSWVRWLSRVADNASDRSSSSEVPA